MSEEVNVVEEQALAKGWKPKEEFEADPKNEGKVWRSAEDFMDRQSFFDKIEEQSRQIKDMRKGLAALSEHNSKIEKLSYEKAINDLKRERREARREGDEDRVDELDDQIDNLKEQKARQPAPVVQETPQALQNWFQANPWYNNDVDMTAYADGMANKLSAQGITGDALLEQVAEKTKQAFSHKFRNPNKDKAPKMETGSPGKKVTAEEPLSAAEEQLIARMVRAGVPKYENGKFVGNMTAEEYRAQYRKARG